MFHHLIVVEQVAFMNHHIEEEEAVVVVETQINARTVRTLEHGMVREVVSNHQLDTDPILGDFLFVVQPFSSTKVSSFQLTHMNFASAFNRNRLTFLVLIKDAHVMAGGVPVR